MLALINTIQQHSPQIAYRLAVIARLKAEGQDRKARSRDATDWNQWLKGGVTTNRNCSGTRRAFLFIRGPTGWTKPTIGTQHEDDAIPEEIDDADAYEAVDISRASNRGLWEPAGIGKAAALRVPLCAQASLEQEADRWSALWKVGTDYFTAIDTNGCPPPPALQVHIVRRGVLSFPCNTGVGSDNTAPRAFNRLSDEVLSAFCVLLLAMERLGDWPAIMRLVLIVLLPKSDGGNRPIGLFPTTIRIWMRVRGDTTAVWDSANVIPGWFGSAGMGAQRAAWQSAFRSEAAALDGLHFSQSALDLVKAFEKIPHEHRSPLLSSMAMI